MNAKACVVALLAIAVAASATGPLHASCRLTWTFTEDCDDVSIALTDAAKSMDGFAGCDNSEKCGYTVTSSNSTVIEMNHKTPVHHYQDDISMQLTAKSGGCSVYCFSRSTIWYAVLDDGTNYCNLHNLVTKAFDSSQFTEDVSASECTQLKSADCSKY